MPRPAKAQTALYDLRCLTGMSQEDFASFLGYTRPYYKKLELEHRLPPNVWANLRTKLNPLQMRLLEQGYPPEGQEWWPVGDLVIAKRDGSRSPILPLQVTVQSHNLGPTEKAIVGLLYSMPFSLWRSYRSFKLDLQVVVSSELSQESLQEMLSEQFGQAGLSVTGMWLDKDRIHLSLTPDHSPDSEIEITVDGMSQLASKPKPTELYRVVAKDSIHPNIYLCFPAEVFDDDISFEDFLDSSIPLGIAMTTLEGSTSGIVAIEPAFSLSGSWLLDYRSRIWPLLYRCFKMIDEKLPGLPFDCHIPLTRENRTIGLLLRSSQTISATATRTAVAEAIRSAEKFFGAKGSDVNGPLIRVTLDYNDEERCFIPTELWFENGTRSPIGR